MPRVAKVWWRESHNAYYAKINGKQLRLSTEFREAQQLFHKLKGQPRQIVATSSVYAVLDEYLEWTKYNRPRSYTWYQAMLKWFTDHFRKTMPHLRVDQLKPIDVSRWLNETDYMDSTKAGIVAALKRAFNWATTAEGGGLIDKNPLAGLKKPEAGRREDFLTQEEFDELIRLVPDQEFQDLLNVLWLTGARPFEITKLQAKQVHNDHIVIEKEKAKGRRRQRIIFLPPAAREIVSRLVKKNPDGEIFRNTSGKVWKNYAINNRFDRLKDENKLGKKVCAYLLRHGFAHRALTKVKIAPETVATLMGHGDTSMIYKVYGHMTANHEFMQEAAAMAAKGAVAGTAKGGKKKAKKKAQRKAAG